jgi:hypothetical protein
MKAARVVTRSWFLHRTALRARLLLTSLTPRGIAFDPLGDLFVAELRAAAVGDILKFSKNGNQTVFASNIGRPQGNGGPEFLAFRGGPPPMP